MRKFYIEFFHIPTDGKIQDKVFSAKIALSVLLILLFMSATVITAYAYYTNNVFVNISDITSAQYELDYSITNEKNETIYPSDGKYSLGAGAYSVSITKKETENSARTGFCVVYINNTKYYTAQIGTDVNSSDGNRETLEFTLVVPDNAEVSLSFEAHWGTSSNYPGFDDKYYIKDKDEINVAGSGSNAAVPEADPTQNEVSEEPDSESKDEDLNKSISDVDADDSKKQSTDTNKDDTSNEISEESEHGASSQNINDADSKIKDNTMDEENTSPDNTGLAEDNVSS